MAPVSKRIAVVAGDGIGPEVTTAATSVLQSCAAEFGHTFELIDLPFGGTAIDRCGSPLPAETLSACREADAILLGAVGGPKWDALSLEKRPESGLLGLRKQLGLNINLRPVKVRASLLDISPLKPERARGVDIEIVRELAGGIYFGEHRTEGKNGSARASDVEVYTSGEIERVAKFGFARAARRGHHLTSIDKANVLASSVLWRKVVSGLAPAHPETKLDHIYVDNAALQLTIAPKQFDVIVTSNMFGDILSDGAAGVAGSLGLIPSMSCAVSEKTGGRFPSLYEPIHGSAPSIAGRDIACPIGAIASVAMMLRESFGLAHEADAIETALDRVLDAGYRTPDLASARSTIVGCSQFAALTRDALQERLAHAERYGWGV